MYDGDMQPSWHWLERIIIRCIPASFTVLMLLFGSVLSRIPGAGQLMPLFNVINIYYWCIFFPGSLPYIFLFIIGILQDSLSGTPLGFSSFINVLFAWGLITRFNTMGNVSFATLWLRFIILSLAVIVMGWFIMSMYYSGLLSIRPQLLQWMSTCLAYPAIHFFLTRVYQRIRN